jgi:zinc protease
MNNSPLTRCTTACIALIAGSVSILSTAHASAPGDLPTRPEKLTFPPLRFEPPKAATYRTTLSNGTPVYMLPSREFPLINLSITCMGGSNLDPADRAGLASMTATMIRRGGTTSMEADEVDEKIEFMAANIGVASADWRSTASVDALKSNFEDGLGILVDMLRNPAFDEEKFAVARADALEGLKQRNDDAASISGREWSYLVFGENHFESRQLTGDSLAAITQDEMRAMAARIFHPGNMIIAVTGDFEIDAMKAMLEKAFAGWTAGPRNAPPDAPTHQMKPGVFYSQKDIPQGKVSIGMRSINRDDPDYFPYLVMNEILGGGGFSSRIMQRVRSDEGLAYSAGSRFSAGPFYPGVFRAAFESKSPTCALATKLIIDEINRMRDTLVSASELETAKNSFVETFPNTFASKAGMLGVFVSDEWTKRPAGFWETYRDKIRAVTPEDIQRVARKHLDPSKLTILVVGSWDDIAKGDAQGRARMDLFGPATRLPDRDPVSLKPIAPASASSAAPKTSSQGS